MKKQKITKYMIGDLRRGKIVTIDDVTYKKSELVVCPECNKHIDKNNLNFHLSKHKRDKLKLESRINVINKAYSEVKANRPYSIVKLYSEVSKLERLSGKFKRGRLVVCPKCNQLVNSVSLEHHLKFKCNKLSKEEHKKTLGYKAYTTKQHLLSVREKQLLSRLTEAEIVMSNMLQEGNMKFTQQKGFMTKYGFYIVDFYIPYPHRGVVIEVDGEYHLEKRQIEYDKRRTDYLEQVREIPVLRFTNNEVLNNSKGVIEKLKKFLTVYGVI